MNPESDGILVIDFPLPGKVRRSYQFIQNFLKILMVVSENVWAISGNISPSNAIGKGRLARIGFGIYFLRDSRHRTLSILSWLIRSIAIQTQIVIAFLRFSRQTKLVIFFMMPPYLEVVNMLLAKLLRKKIIKVPLGPAPRSQVSAPVLYEVSESLVLRLADYDVPEYESNVPRLVENGQLKYPGKLLPAGHFYIQEDGFRKTNSMSQRGKIVGYIGGFRKIKGIMNLIEAARLVLERATGIEFLIVGDGDLKVQVHGAAGNMPPGRVRISDWVPHDELPEVLNQLRVLVVPSYSEGVPNIVIEAMACGTPVISTRVGIIPELIEDGKNGFILMDNSPKTIAERVSEVVNMDDDSLQRVADNAICSIRERYSFESSIEKWTEIITKVK